MKNLAIIIALATLGGCATYYPAPANYGTRAYAPVDANGWQVVSVTPVAPGTAASSQSGTVTSQSNGAYSAGTTTVVTQPVYVPTPVYAPAPVYADPYWYPPVSIGLDFGFGHWGGGHWGGHHGYGRGWRH